MNSFDLLDFAKSHAICIHFQTLLLNHLCISSPIVWVYKLLSAIKADVILLVFLSSIFIDVIRATPRTSHWFKYFVLVFNQFIDQQIIHWFSGTHFLAIHSACRMAVVIESVDRSNNYISACHIVSRFLMFWLAIYDKYHRYTSGIYPEIYKKYARRIFCFKGNMVSLIKARSIRIDMAKKSPNLLIFG